MRSRSEYRKEHEGGSKMNAGRLSFQEMCEIEPGLLTLCEDVKNLSPEKAALRGRWYAREFKPRFSALVGFDARMEALRTMEAYDIALEYLMRQVPVYVSGVVSSDGKTVAVECPYCGRTHTHGRGNGPRLSHCMEDARPYVMLEAEER